MCNSHASEAIFMLSNKNARDPDQADAGGRTECINNV